MLSIKTLFENSQPRLNLVDVTRYGLKANLEETKFFGKNNQKILLNNNTVKALIRAKKMLPEGYNFVITWGYRGYKLQVKINEYMKEKLQKSNPHNWEDMLITYTGGDEYLKYLRTTKSFSHMSHASGKTVDIGGITDKNNNSIDLGGWATNITDQPNYYETKTSPKDIIIRDNRRMLKNVMTKNDFECHKEEWWHWGYKK